MNIANLQLEGVYAVLAELLATLNRKGVLDNQETEDMLRRAERRTGEDAERRQKLSLSEIESVLFPIRLLLEANRATARDENLGFSDLARLVGQLKPPRPGLVGKESVAGKESLALAAETERERDA